MPTIGWSDLLYPGEAAEFFVTSPLPTFDANDAAFNWNNAWWLAELSRLVYRQDTEEVTTPLEPRRTAILERIGMRQRAFFHDPDQGIQAFIVESQTYAALVFRGTDQNIRDLLCDLEIGTALGAGVRIHKGFERAFNRIWPQIEAELRYIDKPLFFAGHSLGAALAILAAARRKPIAVFAYGSPRVGNAAFVAQLADVSIYRVENGSDAVTVVPPEAMGFKHAGEAIHIGSPGLAINFDISALWTQWTSPPKPLADHAPLSYVAALASLAAGN
jgi:triacylglycerol lipase